MPPAACRQPASKARQLRATQYSPANQRPPQHTHPAASAPRARTAPSAGAAPRWQTTPPRPWSSAGQTAAAGPGASPAGGGRGCGQAGGERPTAATLCRRASERLVPGRRRTSAGCCYPSTACSPGAHAGAGTHLEDEDAAHQQADAGHHHVVVLGDPGLDPGGREGGVGWVGVRGRAAGERLQQRRPTGGSLHRLCDTCVACIQTGLASSIDPSPKPARTAARRTCGSATATRRRR